MKEHVRITDLDNQEHLIRSATITRVSPAGASSDLAGMWVVVVDKGQIYVTAEEARKVKAILDPEQEVKT